MSNTIRETFREDQLDIMLTALTYYSNRCKTNATRKLQGYGTAREQEKREVWQKKHEEVEQVINILSSEMN